MNNLEVRYTVEDRERWKKALLAKGAEISAILEKLLAKKDVSLEDLDLKMKGDNKEPKEKRLRRYFDLVMERLRAVDDPGFGFDKTSGEFVSKAVLDDTPWIDTNH